ncbi:winged helix-turn-helix domain-containing protein [Paucibacter sp. APW11]|uniref:Winged helix-turn-helix domain-containing protein n=1 Tax=Roseateles aquae TaxID=3077235 RepID=A0ABU3PB65_9BURK|nr:winged helix-turn-helix domain-containing protein [Paucibacter sp. APW11]MDT8999785.1 winged helix-turn-helix domain-containing protein [Paucibacter sp. APW11]
MDRLPEQALQIGDWRLEPGSGALSRVTDGGASAQETQEAQRLDARPLRLLIYLAGRAGETISMDELLEQVWPGVVVTQDSVYQAITALRRALGDDSKQPRYIATVPRLGYRLIAPVQTLPITTISGLSAAAANAALQQADAARSAELSADLARPAALKRLRLRLSLLLPALLLAVVAGFGLWQQHSSAPAARTLAVLPFLDLTDAMDAEPLADGMTEQLIDVLGRHRELQVQARSRVFAYKGRDWPASRIGQELGVSQVLEGSIRGNGEQLRISVQLVQVSDGKVRWSASYDRPRTELLKLQGEVAQQIEQAVGGTLGSGIAP